MPRDKTPSQAAWAAGEQGSLLFHGNFKLRTTQDADTLPEISIFFVSLKVKNWGMADQIWNELVQELREGLQDPSHPFRLATLATLGLERLPRLRTVRIREFDPGSLRMAFYTDSRSKKILHIKENNKVSLLLYHPEKLVQLRIEGLALRERDPEVLHDHWMRVEGNAQQNYTTASAPGTEIKSPEQIEYLEQEQYFTLVYILPFKVEYLKLHRPHHLRVRFSKTDNGWKSTYLVP